MTQEPGYGELSMTINAESLSQLPFFAHLDAEALRRIVPHVREQARKSCLHLLSRRASRFITSVSSRLSRIEVTMGT